MKVSLRLLRCQMIFEEQDARKPDLYPWTEQFMRAMWDGHWSDREFSFSSDKHDFYTKLNEQEQEVIIRALSAIAQIEVAVKTFWAKLGDNLPHPSIRDMGYVMANIEVVHNKAYERLLEELNLESVFEENLKLDWISGRVNYLKKYNHRYYKDSKKQFVYALVLFTLFVENVSLFSQFYVINWFGRKNLLKDTNQQTHYTLLEEDLHAKAGMKIINTIREEHPELFDDDLEQKILHEANEAFMAESKIVDWMVNGTSTEFLSADILKEFIRNRINCSLKDIGYQKLYNDIDQEKLSKTIWFDEQILGNGMTDFFFQRPVEYAKSNQSFDADDLFGD